MQQQPQQPTTPLVPPTRTATGTATVAPAPPPPPSTRPLFDFPFATPYDVQVRARSYVHARMVDRALQGAARQMQRDISSNGSALSAGGSVSALRQQSHSGFVGVGAARAGAGAAAATAAAAADWSGASPRATALLLPTGVGKTQIALSTALHVQNVIARQNALEEHLAQVRQSIGKQQLKAVRKQLRTATTAAKKEGVNVAGRLKAAAAASAAATAQTAATTAPPADESAGDRVVRLTRELAEMTERLHAEREQFEKARAMTAADWLGSEEFAKDFCDINAWLPGEEGSVRSVRNARDAGIVAAREGEEGAGRGRALKKNHLPALDPNIPRVIFLTRTHAQIKELTNELRRFAEAGNGHPLGRLVSTVVLGSRRELCVHPGVRNGRVMPGRDGASYSGSNALGEFCDKCVANDQCPAVRKRTELASEVIRAGGVLPAEVGHGGEKQYAAVFAAANRGEQERMLAAASNSNSNPTKRVWDIEDIASRARAVQACSYYAARDLAQTQRVLFMPYPYLFDPLIRHESRIENVLANSVIVVDEAHHLPGQLQDGFSFSFGREAIQFAAREEWPQYCPDPEVCLRLPPHHPLRSHRFFNEAPAAPTYERNLDVMRGMKHIKFDHLMQFTYDLLVALHGVVCTYSRKHEAAAGGPDGTPIASGRQLMGMLHQELVSLPWHDPLRSFVPFMRLAPPEFHVSHSAAAAAAPVAKATTRTRFADLLRQQQQAKEQEATAQQQQQPQQQPQPQQAANIFSADAAAAGADNAGIRYGALAGPISAEEIEVRRGPAMLEAMAQVWMSFGVSFNPFSLCNRTVTLLKGMSVALLHLARYPDSFTSYYEPLSGADAPSTASKMAGGGSGGPATPANGAAAGVFYAQVEGGGGAVPALYGRDDAALMLRCLDASIGWRHLTRTVKHVLLMSGTLGTPELLSAQLQERFVPCTDAAGMGTQHAAQPFDELLAANEAMMLQLAAAKADTAVVAASCAVETATLNNKASAEQRLHQQAAAAKVAAAAAAAATARAEDGASTTAADNSTAAAAAAAAGAATLSSSESSSGSDDDDDDDGGGGGYEDPYTRQRNQLAAMVNGSVPEHGILHFTHLYAQRTTRTTNWLSGEHVADPARQARCAILTHLHDGRQALLQYQQQQDKGFMEALVETVARLLEAVPHGSLVFCPSYKLAKDLFFPIRKRMEGFCRRTGRKLFLESSGNGGGGFSASGPPSASGSAAVGGKKLGAGGRNAPAAAAAAEEEEDRGFAADMAAYRQAGMSLGGASFFGVCRGKISEGVNLSNHLSRAVIVIGVPFGNVKAPAIRAQKQYAETVQQCSNWYVVDALVAVQQAVGRALRSTDDFGTIVLLDCRYANMSWAHANKQSMGGAVAAYREQCRQAAHSFAPAPENPALSDLGRLLPAWLRPHIFPSSDVAALAAEMRKFLEDKEREQQRGGGVGGAGGGGFDAENRDPSADALAGTRSKRRGNGSGSDDDDGNGTDEADDGTAALLLGSSGALRGSSWREGGGSAAALPGSASTRTGRAAAAAAKLLHPHLAGQTAAKHAAVDDDADMFGADLGTVQRAKAVAVAAVTPRPVASAAADGAGQRPKEVCRYDGQPNGCYQRNVEHLARFAHPNREARDAAEDAKKKREREFLDRWMAGTDRSGIGQHGTPHPTQSQQQQQQQKKMLLDDDD